MSTSEFRPYQTQVEGVWIRFFGPLQSWFNQTRRPGEIEMVK